MADYLALPKGDGRQPAVVVIQEWWGINDQIRGVVDRWADEGFVAFAPDLFHGETATYDRSDRAQELMSKLDRPRALQDVATAIESMRTHARSNGKIAITGYCMGGGFTLAAAASVKGLSACVPFYGLPPGADWAAVEAPIQMHVASHDDWVTVAAAKALQAQLEAAGKSFELHVYNAKHAFCNEKRREVYDADAAKLAWSRALAFVRARTA